MLSISQIKRAPKKNYMNAEQLAFYKGLLLEQKEQAETHLRDAKANLSKHVRQNDDLDRAQIEEENRLMLRIVERETILIKKIGAALRRIEDGTYGYCEQSGKPIGTDRLLVRPTATLSAEEKIFQEAVERNFSD